MIGVWKKNEEIRIVTNNELINVTKIKAIIKTIKKIHKNATSPCRIILNSTEHINFSLRGELFYEKIITHKKLEKLEISFE